MNTQYLNWWISSLLFSSILLLGGMGCTTRAERFSFPDGGSVLDVWTSPHPCITQTDDAGRETLTTSDDFFNCGSCEYICDSLVTDRCVENSCRCGNEPSCALNQECRFGECRDSDLTGTICEFDDECFAGYACIRGRCSFVRCVPEVCDNIDNDCDGIIDGTDIMPLSRWCYDQDIPATMMLNPPCVRGVQVCETGTWTECVGSVPPRSEAGLLACDGLDNDCDGCPDGVLSTVPPYACLPLTVAGFDIVYAIDISGSMGATIAAAKTATNTFSAMYRTNPSFRFGLVVFPSDLRDGTSEVILTLTDFITFESALMPIRTGGGGSEPSWDVVTQLGTGELNVGWRRGTIRIIILFTDESAQSYTTPRNTEYSMCEALTHGEVLAAVVRSSFFFQFDECARTFNLTPDPVEMVDNLSTIISNPCLNITPSP